MNSLNLLQWISILVMMIAIILVQACVADIPLAVKDVAISALCDFPPFSGNNMCREAKIIRFVKDNAITSPSIENNSEKSWCVEVAYIDYTGERGFASVWVIESSTVGDYMLYKGPEFDVNCDRMQ